MEPFFGLFAHLSKRCPSESVVALRKLEAFPSSRATVTMSIDYETIQKIQKLADDVLIGVAEVAALTGFSALTVRQRKLPGLEPVPGLSRLRWRLGDLRQWMRTGAITSVPLLKQTSPEGQQKVGRPTKKAQVEARK